MHPEGIVGNKSGEGESGRRHRNKFKGDAVLAFATQPGVVVMVVNVIVRKEVREKVEALDRDGKCVRCGRPYKVRRLGLCNTCHYRYREDRKNKPQSEINLLDAKERRAGILMESRQGQRLKDQSA